MADDKSVTIRVRRFLVNKLLQRKQLVVDVVHHGQANVSKADVGEKIAKMFKVSDSQLVMAYGFRSKYGGGRSTGIVLIYDNLNALRKFEPKYRLIRGGFEKPAEGRSSNKARKAKKNKMKKQRGTKPKRVRNKD